jgi:hypothetical protein
MLEILKKIESYIACDTKIACVVYPDEREVDVWRPVSDGSLNKQKFGLEDILDASDALPGFIMTVRDMFYTIV